MFCITGGVCVTGGVLGGIPVPYRIEYLVLAGGGGGGHACGRSNGGGGGGAGGARYSCFCVNCNQTYTISVGGGGAGGIPNSINACNRGNSCFACISTSCGGGRGGTGRSPGAGGGQAGCCGGSGGGGAVAAGQGGTGILGEGNDGGCAPQPGIAAGGGGGISSVGCSMYCCYGGPFPTPYCLPVGGNGCFYPLNQVFCFGDLSNSCYWIGGAGGGGYYYGQAPGGLGGGGSGGSDGFQCGCAGQPNMGAGGGGGGTICGGAGGSGSVFIRYPSEIADATTTGSPCYCCTGGFKYYWFKGSGTIAFCPCC